MAHRAPPGYHRIAQRTISDFEFFEVLFDPGTRLSEHMHSKPGCTFVLEGSFEEVSLAGKWECRAPAILFRLPKEMHANLFHEHGAHLLKVEMNQTIIERIAECGRLPERSFVSNDSLLTALAVKVYKEFADTDDFSDITIEGLMLELVARILRDRAQESVKRPLWLERAKEIIHGEFSSRLSVNEIASRVGVHPVHLAREFQKHFQRSIGEYVRELRIHMACRELSKSERPIFEIAYEAGFSDHSHFCRIFKKLLGLTPAEYRLLFRSTARKNEYD